jgi:uncharacterized protein YneF (UPF0154 family)
MEIECCLYSYNGIQYSKFVFEYLKFSAKSVNILTKKQIEKEVKKLPTINESVFKLADLEFHTEDLKNTPKENTNLIKEIFIMLDRKHKLKLLDKQLNSL